MRKIDSIASFLVKLLLLIISSFIALFFAELSTRFYGKINGIDFRLYMQELKNSNRLPNGILEPNSQVLATTSDFSVIYKTNSKGLRDKEYSYIKPKNKIRILAFGDSYTFGEGVEYGKRFTDIPENHYSNLEIINFGSPGWGIDKELVLFAAEGLKYSPDYVIIFINLLDVNRYSTNILRNDVIVLEHVVSQKPVNDPSTLFLSKDDALFYRDSSPILKKSQFLNYLNYQITLIKLKRNLEKQDKEIWGKIAEGSVENNKNEAINIQKRVEMIILKFNEICKENNIKLIIIKIDSYGNLDYIAHLDSNILYYDLTDGLKQESKRYKLNFKYDGHYNKKTHNYIGRKVIEILQEIMVK